MTQPPPGPCPPGGHGGQQPPGYGPAPGPYGTPPQGPYGPRPPGPYGAWPSAPLPPPRRGPGGGAVTALVLGALVLVGAVVFGIGAVVSASRPHGTEKLAFPATLEDGRYHRIDGNPQVAEQQRQLQHELPGDGTAKVATYSAGASGDPTAGGLAISGAYGDIDIPSVKMRDDMLDGLQHSGGGGPVGERHRFSPGSAGVEVSCQVTRLDAGLYAPACAWADESTAATVLRVSASATTPGGIGLKDFAGATVRAKDQVTAPK